MNPVFLNDWADGKLQEIMSDFRITDADIEGVEIILASYSYQDYSGDAFVLFLKNGKYYEVNGGHCSCYGLEGQWEPEEASINELLHRVERGQMGNSYCGNEFADELKEILLKIKEESANE